MLVLLEEGYQEQHTVTWLLVDRVSTLVGSDSTFFYTKGCDKDMTRRGFSGESASVDVLLCSL